jgi:hypothetical protein
MTKQHSRRWYVRKTLISVGIVATTVLVSNPSDSIQAVALFVSVVVNLIWIWDDSE